MSYLNIIVIVVIFVEICCNLNLLNKFSNAHSTIFRIIFILLYIIVYLWLFVSFNNIFVFSNIVVIVSHAIFHSILILLFIDLLFLVRMIMKRFINLFFYWILSNCISDFLHSNIVNCELSFCYWRFVKE